MCVMSNAYFTLLYKIYCYKICKKTLKDLEISQCTSRTHCGTPTRKISEPKSANLKNTVGYNILFWHRTLCTYFTQITFYVSTHCGFCKVDLHCLPVSTRLYICVVNYMLQLLNFTVLVTVGKIYNWLFNSSSRFKFYLGTFLLKILFLNEK